MYRVEHHWDPLKVCLVGTTYHPRLYDFVRSSSVRKTLQTISEQTLEDLENLCNVLKSFGVETHQPNISSNYNDVVMGDKMLPAPLTPRDYTAMIDSAWFMPNPVREQEMAQYDYTWLKPIEQLVSKHGNTVYHNTNGIMIDSAMVHRCGDTLLVGNWTDGDDNSATVNTLKKINTNNFTYFGSSLQYFKNYKLFLKKIFKNKPKYIFISGTTFFSSNKKEKDVLVVKQTNILPHTVYLYFFNFHNFINLLYFFKLIFIFRGISPFYLTFLILLLYFFANW